MLLKIIAAILFALALAFGQAMQGGAQIPALALPCYILVLATALFALPGAFRHPGAPLPLGLSMAFAAVLVWRAAQPGGDPFLSAIDTSAALACGLLVVVGSSGFPDNRSRIWLLAAIGVVLSVQLVVGLLQFTFGGDWMPAGWISADLQQFYADRFSARTRGSFLNPNHFAWAMGTGCLMALSFAVWGRLKVWMRIIAVYLAGVFLIGVILSASRGGILAVGGGLLVFGSLSILGAAFVARRGARSVLLGASLTFAVIAGAALMIYQSAWSAQGRFQELLVPGVRSGYSEIAWRVFQSSPLIGAGSGEFLYSARLLRQPNAHGDAMYAHNDWLQLLAEYGWIALALACAALAALIGNGIIRFLLGLDHRIQEGQKPQSNESALAIGGVSCVTLYALHSIVDFNFHIPANAILAAMGIGLLAGAPRMFAPRRKVISRALVTVGFIGFGIGLMIHLFRHAESDISALQARNALLNGKAPDALAIIERLGPPETFETNPQIQIVQAQASANFGTSITLDLFQSQARHGEPGTDEPEIDFENLDESTIALLEREGRRIAGVSESELTTDSAMDLQSVTAYRHASKLRPKERRIPLEAAQVMARLGRADEAILASREGIRLEPWNAYSYTMYAEVLDLLDRRDDARRMLELASRMPDGNLATAAIRRLREEDDILDQIDLPPPSSEP